MSILLSGCATLTGQKNAKSQDEPKVRREQALKEFEKRRDQAQLEAAMSRWEEGDSAGSAKLLRTLLTRNPGNLDARLQLVDVLLSMGAKEEAEAEARYAINAAPQDPRAKHAMGLVRESQGNPQAARALYAAASQAEPDNAVFQASYQAASGADVTRRTPPGAETGHPALHPRIIHLTPTPVAADPDE